MAAIIEQETRDDEQQHQCAICLDRIHIPVTLRSFYCHRIQWPSSFSSSTSKQPCDYPVCLMCAIRFLQLDRPLDRRDEYMKCLFCPLVITDHLKMSSFEDAFHVNFQYMRELDRIFADTTSPLQCRNCAEPCPSQYELLRHYLRLCPQFPLFCECHQTFPREILQEHTTRCSFFTFCSLCLDYIPKSTFYSHHVEVHQRTRCIQCGHLVPITNISEHLQRECKERYLCCGVCYSLIRFPKFISHLHDHMNKIQYEIKQLEDLLHQKELDRKKIEEAIYKANSEKGRFVDDTTTDEGEEQDQKEKTDVLV